MPAPTTTPKRRPSGEVRDRLLEAGREVFAERGFSGATTREIATRAGVVEVLLFRHFGSKGGLFVESVLHPLHDFVADQVGRVEADPQASIEDLMDGFIGRLYDLISANRELFLALVAAAEFDPEVLDDAGEAAHVGDLWGVFERVAEDVRSERGQAPVDYAVTTRAAIAMVMGMALLDRWLLPSGRRPSRRRLVDAMTWLVVHGLREGSTRPEDAPT